MQVFKSNSSEFYRKTRTRVIFEVLVFCLLAVFFFTDQTVWLPELLKWTILIVVAAYILLGLAFYPKAKSFSQSFVVSLKDDALCFTKGDGPGRIPYSDLIITDVKKKSDEITTISLRTNIGQKIDLRGLENMQGLYKGLIDHGVNDTAK